MNVPKIRFKGFDGEWKKVKLGEIANFSKGYGYSKSDLCENGNPIILYGRLYTQYATIIEDVDTFVSVKENSVFSTGNEVIIPASGETPEDIACASAVLSSGVILGGDLNILCLDLKRFSTPFVALSISSGKTQKELSKFAQGKTIVHLHNSEIAKGTICLPPSLTEQRAIASFFQNLDSMIQGTEKKIASLRQMKEASLQAMFPAEGDTVPKVRFKGFDGEWTFLSFNNIFSLINDAGSNVPKERYQIIGKYPIIDQGKQQIAGYTDLNAPLYPDDKYIVFGDHTREFKIIGFAFFTGADGTKVLKCKFGFDPDFIYSECQNISIPNTGYNRHFGYLKESVFLVPPSLAEQQKIASYFTSLDQQISVQTKRLEKLRQIKSACLDAMFV